MSFFSQILEKIGLGKKDAPAAATTATAAPAKPAVASTPAPVAAPAKPATPAPAVPMSSVPQQAQAAMAAAASAPKAVSEVDVVKHLEELSKGKGLNWKVSIVDLLKLLDIDSSFEARKELATELGCPADLMGDSAKMNVWLHKEVLRKIASNGGNIPQDLLD